MVGQTPIRIRYFRVNKRRWVVPRGPRHRSEAYAEIRSFLSPPHPLSTPPSSAISALQWREQKDRFDRFNVPTAGPRGQWIHLAVDDYPLRIGVQPTVHSSHRNVCIYRSEGARSPMKAFGGGGFRLEASNRSVSIHR